MTQDLSRRERQIMDIVYAEGRATAATVRENLPEAPSYSAVRALLRILEGKGHLQHESDGNRYVYLPTVPRGTARRSALKNLLHTFFDDSPENAMAALLDLGKDELGPDDLDRLAQIIEKARQEGR